MTRTSRTVLLLSVCLGSLLLVAAGTGRGGSPTPDADEDVWTSMTKWTLEFAEDDADEARTNATELVAHMKELHLAVRFEVYGGWGPDEADRLHFLVEAKDTKGLIDGLEELGDDGTCQQLFEEQDRFLLGLKRTWMRLIASDPEKERTIGPQRGLIVRSLRARTTRVGEAVDTAAALVEHLNANYPQQRFRAFDEWHPRSGTIHLFMYGTGVSNWERTEARMRHDAVLRRIFEDADDVFVDDSFEDLWLVSVAR